MTGTKIVYFKRYRNYDYSRGGSIFISFHLEPRIPIFGDVMPDGRVVLSKAGEILRQTIQTERITNSDITIRSFQIMPEHLHFRLTFPANLKNPLQSIGRFVYDIKRWSKARIQKLGLNIEWQKNYHDYLCLSKDINEKVDEYIRLNPMKWALMHSPNPPMKVIEPLDSPLLPFGEWWSGVGNADFLNGSHRIMSVQLSRRLPIGASVSIIPQILSECSKGFILVSTFISPMEKELWRHLCALNYPIVCAVPDQLKTVYRPRVEQTMPFAQRRLLLLSKVLSGDSRERAWHQINYDIARIAENSGGKAIYLR